MPAFLVDRLERLCLPASITKLFEPLFWLMGRRGGQSYKVSAAKRILIVMPDRMGDLILASSFIRELRVAKPDAFICLIVESSLINLVEHCPYIDLLLGYDTNNWQVYWRSRYCLNSFIFSLKHLWQQKFDLAILPHWGTDHYYCGALVYFSGARWRIGYSEAVTKEKSELNSNYDLLYSRVLDDKTARHEVVNNLNLLRFAGMESRDDSLELWLTEAETDKAAQVLNFDNDKCHHFIALCPTASHRRKVWPEERFAQLIDWMLGSIDCHIVLLGSQHNGLSLQSIRQKYPSGVLDLTEKTTVREAAAILARCSMYVGLDTGPMHLAVASKVPVVSISCHPSSANDINPMSFRRFGPWGVPSRIIQPEFALDECAETDDGCQRRDESHCIAQIGIERVKEAIKELIRVLPDENGLQLKKEGFVIE